MSVCTMYVLGAPGGQKSVCGFLQLTKLQYIFLYHLTQDPQGTFYTIYNYIQDVVSNPSPFSEDLPEMQWARVLS